MKSVLFLIRTLNMGGAEHVLVDIANRLAQDGFSVTVQTMIDEGYYRKKLEANVHYRGGFRSRYSLAKKIVMRLYWLLPGKTVSKLIIGKGYTHLVAFTEGYPTKIVAGCCKRKAKKIAWVHTDLYSNYETVNVFHSEKKNRKCYECFDHIICVSNDAKSGYEKRMGTHKSIRVQYNPLNKLEIVAKAQAKAEYIIEDAEAVKIIAIGRLEKIKGFDLLIEAMDAVRRRANRPVKLYIIGGGCEKEALNQQILKFGLQDIVKLCGPQGNPYSIMSQCDMQVIPSRAEGYSLVLCEGHFLGLPAVATKCAGPVEIMKNSRGGILVDISPEALADGIVQMVNDEKMLSECKKNVAKWSENYDVDAVYKQIEAVFD